MKFSYNGNILREPTSFPDQYNGALMHRYIDLEMMWVFVEYVHCMRFLLNP